MKGGMLSRQEEVQEGREKYRKQGRAELSTIAVQFSVPDPSKTQQSLTKYPKARSDTVQHP